MSSAIENELPLLPRIVETFDSSRSSESSPNASSSRASDPGKTQKDQEASLEESELKTLLELPLPPLPPADDAAAGAADAAALGAALSSVLRVGAARSKGSLSRPSSFALLPTPPDLPAFPEDTRNLFVRIRASGEFLLTHCPQLSSIVTWRHFQVYDLRFQFRTRTFMLQVERVRSGRWRGPNIQRAVPQRAPAGEARQARQAIGPSGAR